MPVSLATLRDPFRSDNSEKPPTIKLRVPQARVLQALMPPRFDDKTTEWPIVTRVALAQLAGYRATSGSITRALNGIREGSSSGDPHPGLIELGLVRVIELDIDGLSEVNFQITSQGIEAIKQYLESGNKLPPVRDASLCINDRYKH